MLLLIDKPKGMTSHDVVDFVRKITGEKKVGHGGTLDPNATGLLIVGVGREDTKKLGEISKYAKKEYIAEIVLGEERDTDDVEGKITKKYGKKIPSKVEINKVLSSLRGSFEQIPPSYSAIKIKGMKSYQLAHKGVTVNLRPKKVTVYSIKLLNYNYPVLKILCRVSSGTYIRALARDIGRMLKTGAFINNLRRTKVNQYAVEDAKLLSDLKKDIIIYGKIQQ